MKIGDSQLSTKRAIDLTGSIIGLILVGPIMLATSLAIKLKMGSPIFFKQQRPGINSKPFTIYKFRTMLDLRDEHGLLLENEKRITPLGKFLRKASLDELPELINVLKGDMSLVGPRPLLIEYLDFYTPEQARRHEMKPGITGFAQVNGRNDTTWEDRFRLDVWYVDNWSIWLDLKILFLTAINVIKMKGISPEGKFTMPRFTGHSANTFKPIERDDD